MECPPITKRECVCERECVSHALEKVRKGKGEKEAESVREREKEICVCGCVCVCARERERDMCVWLCVCVSERERERECARDGAFFALVLFRSSVSLSRLVKRGDLFFLRSEKINFLFLCFFLSLFLVIMVIIGLINEYP